MQRKCCVHCPGSVTRTGEPIREHACCGLPMTYGRARSAEPPEEQEQQPQGNSCFERFAQAKRFHAENLQHKPLPDRVDDGIFTVGGPSVERPCACEAVKRCGLAALWPFNGLFREIQG